MYDSHVELAMKCILANRYLHSRHVNGRMREMKATEDAVKFEKAKFSYDIHSECVSACDAKLEKFLHNNMRRNQLMVLKLSFDEAKYISFINAQRNNIF